MKRKRSNPELSVQRVWADLPDPSTYCRGLCSDSCGRIGFTELEEKMAGGPIRFVEETGDCAHLVDGRCAIYEVRPTICRLYGAVEGFECGHGCIPPMRTGGRAVLARVFEVGGPVKYSEPI